MSPLRIVAFVLLVPALAFAQARCKNCDHATSADSATSAGKLTGTISGSQVLSCPAACTSATVATTTTTTTVVTTSTAPATSSGLALDPDGALRLGKWCEDLPSFRGRPAQVGTQACGRNGDVYTAQTAGTTGTTRPPGLPYEEGGLHVGDQVPAGALVYPGWAAWDNPGWIYTARSTCELGAKAPVWCSTAGCQVTSGTCTLTAQAIAPVRFTDGSVVWLNTWTDIGFGGNAGPTATIEDNLPFPRTASERHFGDNSQPPLLLGRGDYGGPDETVAVLGGWGDSRSGNPGSQVMASNPGFLVAGSPTLGIATAPPLVLTSIPGPIPTYQWGCFPYAWENSLGGPTRAGIAVRCMQAVQGGIRVSRPAADGWTWPIPFPVGETMARVYVTLLPGPPCTPLPGQTTCNVLLPKNLFTVSMDYLYGPSDYIDVIPSNLWERDSPTNQNSSGTPISPFAVYESSIGMGVWQPGDLVNVGAPAAPRPDSRWWYEVYGIHCQCDADGRHARHCVRDRSISVPLPNPLPAVWRTDRIPFCLGDANGIAMQRTSAKDTGIIFNSNGYRGSCRWREERWNPSCPAGGMETTIELCDGELHWPKPCSQGTSEIAYKCSAAGCGPVTTSLLAKVASPLLKAFHGTRSLLARIPH